MKRRLAIAAGVLAVLIAAGIGVPVGCMVSMPGKSHRGALPPATPDQSALAGRLMGHVEVLAAQIGERNLDNPDALERAALYVEEQLASQGWTVARQDFEVGELTTRNLIVERTGNSGQVVVIGAHYDSAPGTPGANDNASGTAALLELAAMFRDSAPTHTLRFVAFTNEEPPWFKSADMGSLVYARSAAAAGDDVVAMLSLETMGYYDDTKGSQRYPAPFSLLYPSEGNFIGFVGDVKSRALVRRSIRVFRDHAAFPSQGGALPANIPGVSWSDHWSFWKAGYSGVMVTDTAPNRYAHYHRTTDTPDRVDGVRLARVVEGLEHVIENLSEGG